MSCMWWLTIVSVGAPNRYGQDYDIDGYTNFENEIFMDEDGNKVPLDENIEF